MPSEFGQYSYLPEEKGSLEPLHVNSSGRYEFYRTRISGRLHFVKRLKNEYLTDLKSRDALLKEFRIGYNLDHPGIVRYLRYENEAIYEEYVDGSTLRQLIDSGDPSLKTAQALCRICQELLEAVGHMHSHGVLHLDLKPENVMLTRVDGHVKIIDLGCCISSSCDATPGFTKEHMAPEQASGECLDASTDIYLVGKIMETLSDAAGLGRRWHKFVSRATASDYNDRFHSAKEAASAIPKTRTSATTRKYVSAFAVIAAITLAGVAGYNLAGKRLQQSAENVQIARAQRVDTVVKVVREIVTDTTNSAKSDNSKVADSRQSAESAPRETSGQRFRRLLSAHISDYFRRNVKPVCQRPTAEYEAEGKSHEGEILKAKNRAINDAQSYAAKLKRQNPGHDDEIDEILYVVLNEEAQKSVAWQPASWMPWNN